MEDIKITDIFSDETDSTSNTPYNDAFRTMMGKSGTLRIAFINEMFHPSRPIKPDARIDEAVNEHFTEHGNGVQRRLVTDSLLHLDGSTYHIECQSLPDGTILVRMFEYDLAVGIKESRYADYHLTVDIPVSGVLFLRSTKNIPDEMKVTINTVGGSIEYPVSTLKLSNYTLDDLIKKDLLFLFPFYIFNLEKELKAFDEKTESREKVISSFSELLNYVNGLLDERKLDFDKYLLLTDMIQKVADHLSVKYSSARKELDEIMGGKIIEFKGERIFNQGMEKGVEKGKIEGGIEDLLGLVYDNALSVDVAASRAEKKYNVSKDDFMEMVKTYKPDDELKQG